MPPRSPFGFDAAAHERHHGWQGVLAKVAVCSAVTALLWWVGGWIGAVISLRLWAVTLADDLRALIETVWGALRHQAFKPIEGHFYQFKGHRIRVLDDEVDPQRWLAVDDLATALGSPIPKALLRRRWPQSLQEQRDGLYVLDQTALDWLGEQRDDRAGRLRHWVEREVWYPARGRKASYRSED